MPNLTLLFKNNSYLKPVVFVDDKEISIKKKNGKLIGIAACKTNSTLRIETYHPLNQKFGLVISYFFFIISFLGLFDVFDKTKEKRMIFQANLDLDKDSQINLRYNPFAKNEIALEIVGDCSYEVVENRYFLDDALKKKIKLLKKIKLITLLLILICIAIMLSILL